MNSENHVFDAFSSFLLPTGKRNSPKADQPIAWKSRDKAWSIDLVHPSMTST